MATHKEFRKGGVISLFVGNLRTENEILDYLQDGFARDFGFEIDPDDGSEYASSKAPLKIPSLLKGFSREESFADRASDGAGEKGVETANCALVFFNFAYTATTPAKRNSRSPLIFVGVFPLEGVE